MSFPTEAYAEAMRANPRRVGESLADYMGRVALRVDPDLKIPPPAEKRIYYPIKPARFPGEEG